MSAVNQPVLDVFVPFYNTLAVSLVSPEDVEPFARFSTCLHFLKGSSDSIEELAWRRLAASQLLFLSLMAFHQMALGKVYSWSVINIGLGHVRCFFVPYSGVQNFIVSKIFNFIIPYICLYFSKGVTYPLSFFIKELSGDEMGEANRCIANRYIANLLTALMLTASFFLLYQMRQVYALRILSLKLAIFTITPLVVANFPAVELLSIRINNWNAFYTFAQSIYYEMPYSLLFPSFKNIGRSLFFALIYKI
ncbi:MAG: hypothetical protein ACOVOR_05155 [Rhabdochlamydiaceae bacterium]